VSHRALRIPAVLPLPHSTQPFLNSVSLSLTSDDLMYENNDAHYLWCGASALNVILAALQLANAPPPAHILDFGAGAGRVTRWLRAAFATATLSACDLREQDMSFCRSEFLADTWISGIDIDELTAPRTYDLIWVGSVLTHLSADNSVNLIHKLLGWANAGGLLVMSTHGRFAQTNQDCGRFKYLHDEGWEKIRREYVATGYGYADYLNQVNYGISLSKMSWFAGLIEKMPNVRLAMLSEKVWDEHHDVIAIQNRAISS
jgi:trans-aconitate methyltransferase